jgi:cephalosporin hydroxylase
LVIQSVKAPLRPLYRRLVARKAVNTVKRRRPASIVDEVDFALSFQIRGVPIMPFQIRAEIAHLLKLVAAEQPRTVLEIGTMRGGTLLLFTRVAADDALLVTVDLSDETRREFGGDNHAANAPLYRAFARGTQRVEFIAGDSHEPDTTKRITDTLEGRPVDFLFIDGDHTYDGVRSDYEMYSPLVRPGGLIAFHDIVDGPEDAVGGVPKFWREIKTESTCELVQDWGQGGYGIGVLRAAS